MEGGGVARAVRAALADAGVGPEDVDHVNAHGLGGRGADAAEARGLAEVFGPGVAVVAPKSFMGNLGAAGGVTELVASVLALHHGVVPPTLNCEDPDPDCPVAVVGGPRPLRKPYVVKTGFTEMGQCAAAVLRKWE
jgi:3-oxoacyl-[acyl-carrier-protein] synthase II